MPLYSVGGVFDTHTISHQHISLSRAEQIVQTIAMGGGQRLRVLLLVLLAWIGMIHGQGLLPTPKSALGAESVLRSLLKVYRRTTAFQVAYRKAGPSRCKGAGTLCSSDTAKDEAMLLMATSPQVGAHTFGDMVCVRVAAISKCLR